jgi:hypothetical protein
MSIQRTIENASTPFPKGIEPTAWIIPWIDTLIQFGDGTNGEPNEVTMLVPNQLWYPTITATKFGLNAGHTAVVSETKPTAYKHSFTAIKSLMSAADRAALDEMDSIMVIVKKNRGGFAVYGAQNGLWKTAQSEMANDNAAMVTATYESRTDMEEEYEEYTLNFGTGQTDDIVKLILSVDETLGIIVTENVISGVQIVDVNGGIVTAILVNTDGAQSVASAHEIIEDVDFAGDVYVFPLLGQDIGIA